MADNAILKLLQKLHRRRHKPDLHSFKAKIKGGVTYVEAWENFIYMEFFTYDADGNETRTQWSGPISAAVRELEKRGLDLPTVET